MDNLFKQLTEEIKQYIANNPLFDTKDFVEKTKAAEDTGTFEVIISTADQDRQGEIVDINGWDLENYKANPIVLWAHDYHQLPVGVADEIEIKEGKLTARGRFASADANPFAQQVRKLYDAKIIKTTSVGFIARKMEGNVITDAELLEFSFVPVPANPYALSLRQAKELGIDTAVAKDFNIEIKDEERVQDEPKNDPVEPEIAPVANDNAEVVPEAEKPETEPKTEAIQDPEKPSETEPETPADTEEKGIKEGRTISGKNAQKIKSAIDAMKAASVALEELLETVEPAKGAAEGDDKNVEPQNDQKVEVVGSDPIVEALKKWSNERTVLRALNNATSRALAEFNSKNKRK